MSDHESTPQERRRSLVVVAVVSVVALAGTVWLTAGSSDQTPTVDADGRPVPTLSAAAEPLDEPVRLPERGSYVDAQVQPDGTVEVVQWLRGSSAIEEVRLAAYHSAQVPTPPRATDLEVRTSLGEVTVPETTVGPAPMTVDLVRPSLVVRLSYRLRGVTVQSSSPPGRALVGVVSLDAAYEGEEGRSRVQVGGRRVLALACEPLGGSVLDQRPCGAPRDGGWSVNLIGPQIDTRVMAQVDLDAPAGATSSPVP